MNDRRKPRDCVVAEAGFLLLYMSRGGSVKRPGKLNRNKNKCSENAVQTWSSML